MLSDWWAEFGGRASISKEFNATVTCGLASNYPKASATEIAMRFQKTGLSELPFHYKLMGISGPLISYLKPTRTVFHFVMLPYLAYIMTQFSLTYFIFLIWPDLVLFKLDERMFYDTALLRMEGRAIAKTKSGRLALVPEYSLKGDIIVLCKGGRVPLVLRHVPNSDGFKIVGESYVHAVMTGREMYNEERCRPLSIV
jgi:hypothetical protein